MPRRFILSLICCLCLFAVKSAAEHVSPDRIESAIERGVDIILDMQDDRQWPYEGVYRVRGSIPIGYRVGGTAIAATAILHAPDLKANTRRVEAIERAAEFIIESIDHPLMAPEFQATYDVRGWGYVYGLAFLLEARDAGFETTRLDRAITFFIAGIIATEIPQHGGWNYARRAGFDRPGPPSPFMTAATLQALFAASEAGFDVPRDMIERGLDALQRAKQASGGYVYSGSATERSREGVPGAVGRMLIAESTLHLAGRSSQADVRGAIDAFLVHWEWLEKRRAKEGTHAPPYGVAPYYFFFAHYYAAQAVELLPHHERAEYRRRVNERLLAVQNEDGSWNDRVFPRSAAYGTAMALLSLMMPDRPPAARFSPQGESSETADEH